MRRHQALEALARQAQQVAVAHRDTVAERGWPVIRPISPTHSPGAIPHPGPGLPVAADMHRRQSAMQQDIKRIRVFALVEQRGAARQGQPLHRVRQVAQAGAVEAGEHRHAGEATAAVRGGRFRQAWASVSPGRRPVCPGLAIRAARRHLSLMQTLSNPLLARRRAARLSGDFARARPARDRIGAGRLPRRGRRAWSPIRRARTFATPDRAAGALRGKTRPRLRRRCRTCTGSRIRPALRDGLCGGAGDASPSMAATSGQNRDLYEAVRQVRDVRGLRHPRSRAAAPWSRTACAAFAWPAWRWRSRRARASRRHPDRTEQGRDRIRRSRARRHRRLDAAGDRGRAGRPARFGARDARPCRQGQTASTAGWPR